MKTPPWLYRRISPLGPHLCLCLSEDEYRAVKRRIKAESEAHWTGNGHSMACVHTFENNGEMVTIVCMRDFEGRNPIEVAGLLVHESVHIWQQWCDWHGETRPGSEQEAYAIQGISQELMAEFARRMGQ
jgi:hypothetical protein